MDPRTRAINVQLVQPVIPPYRKTLFERLSAVPGLDLEFHASPMVNGIRSVTVNAHSVDVDHVWMTLGGERLFWQSDMALSPHMKQGDVLVLSGNPRILSNYPLIWSAHRRGVATLWWSHGWTAGAHPAAARVRRALMRHLADAVLLYTDEEVRDFVARGFSPDRVFATNNAIDQRSIEDERAKWTDDGVAVFRTEHHIDATPVVLFAGRLTPKAQLHVLLQALSVLADRDQLHLHLVIVGDGPERSRLQERVASYGLADSVTWVGEEYREAELCPWFLSADVFVYPGSIGLSLLHAFGYSLPVITHGNRRNQMPEIAALNPGINGAVFAEGDATDLASVLRDLVLNREQLASMRHSALKIVRDEFSIDGMVGRFAEAIRRTSELKLRT